MTCARHHLVLVVVGFCLCASTAAAQSDAGNRPQSIEEAILAVNAEMTRAGEALDADRLLGFMLDTDKVSVIQNGVVFVTRQEALEQLRANLRGIARIQYQWRRQFVTVLSPEVALLTAEGESVATTTAGDTFTAPFAQTVVFVLRAGAWKAIHAHQSSPRAR